MYSYEVVKDDMTETIKRTDKDGLVAWIPCDPANSDYQRYLRFLAGEPEGILGKNDAETL